eukprot:765375-Hanusia_phi.AAC.1
MAAWGRINDQRRVYKSGRKPLFSVRKNFLSQRHHSINRVVFGVPLTFRISHEAYNKRAAEALIPLVTKGWPAPLGFAMARCRMLGSHHAQERTYEDR